MKYFKYLVIALFSLSMAVACTTEEPAPDNAATREAFSKETQIGVYQAGVKLFAFDKAKHQLYISPSQYIMRVQSDDASQYVEFQLTSMPAVGAATTATVRQNIGITTQSPFNDLTLLKSADGNLWLWSDAANTGVILPWIAE